MKYRKKPVVIEAVEWKRLNQLEMARFLDEYSDHVRTENEVFRIDFCNGGCQLGDLHIKTLSGEVKADIGDFICKGVEGEFYPCKPDIFWKTYEEVEE